MEYESNIIKIDDKNKYFISFYYNDKRYTIIIFMNYLYFNGKKYKLAIKGSYFEYVYKIQKTKINIQNEEKFYNHFVQCLKENFAVKSWVINPLEHIERTTKPCI